MSEPLADQTIIHVLTTVQHGGAERVALDLARRQRALGASPRVVCLQQLGALEPEFAAAGIPIMLLPGSDRPGALRTAWQLAAELRRTAPAVVHTHNSAPQITAGLGQRLRRWRKMNTALVHTEHGRLPDLRPVRLQLRRWTAAQFDAVIAVSANAQAQLLAHGICGATGVELIVNGVDTSRFKPRAARARGTHVVHVGRLDVIKGQDVLIDAVAAARASVPALTLTIVGDGPTRTQLEAQASRLGITGAVTFLGALADVRPVLGDADIFVLPSRSEGISIALLEAMSSGLTCIATDVGGNREVIASPRTGTLVAPERPDLLADALVAALTNPEQAAAQGAAARQDIEARFAFERTVDAYSACYARSRYQRASQALGTAA